MDMNAAEAALEQEQGIGVPVDPVRPSDPDGDIFLTGAGLSQAGVGVPFTVPVCLRRDQA